MAILGHFLFENSILSENIMDITKKITLKQNTNTKNKHLTVRYRTDSHLIGPSPHILAFLESALQQQVCVINTGCISIICNNIKCICYRTAFCVHIMVDELCVTTKEGRQIQLSHEEQELKDFILTQVCTNQVSY